MTLTCNNGDTVGDDTRGASAGLKSRSPHRLRRKAACGVTAAGNRLDWVRREGDSTARAWAALEEGDRIAEEELRPSVGKAVPPPEVGDAAVKELEAVGGVCGGSRSEPPLLRDTGSELRLAPRVGKDGDGASCFLLDARGEAMARLCACVGLGRDPAPVVDATGRSAGDACAEVEAEGHGMAEGIGGGAEARGNATGKGARRERGAASAPSSRSLSL